MLFIKFRSNFDEIKSQKELGYNYINICSASF